MRNYHHPRFIIMEAGEAVVGIDLGTTNSCIAIKRNGQIDVIPNREGKRTTLSFVHYTTNGVVLVGKIAKHQSTSNPANGIYEIKRIIGCQHDELDIEKEKQWLAYGFIRGVNGETHIELEDSGGEKYYKHPEEVCGRILHKLKLDAEAYLGRKLSKAVITVPAYFNNNQRAATRDAARIAGFDPIKLINEPSAAAVAYIESSQTGQTPEPPRTILIYDLGGGTFDVSIVKTGDQASAASGVRVLSVSGDVRLGGRDFVCHLADYITSEIETRCNTIISDNPRNVRNVMDHCERIKKILTVSSSTPIILPEFTTSEGKQVEFEITRSKFEELNRVLFERTIEIVDACIRQRRLSKRDIDEVLLVGGSSRMPKVEQLLKTYFGDHNPQIKRNINADEAIAIGAAIEADFLSKSLKTKTEVADEDQQVSILTDVLPLSIGTVLDEGTIFFNFAKNTPLPASSTHVHRVDRKRKQKSEHILSFYEGDHLDYHKNVLLGAHEVKFPSQCTKKEIKVTMKINTNGIIRIMASGETIKKFNIVLNKGRLEEEEIAKIRTEVQKIVDS